MADEFNCNLDINVNKVVNKERFSERQRYIDSECVRLMDPYTPLDTGTLKKAPLTQTEFGSGEIIQSTPYARRQYYTNRGQGLRGAYWFERMKQKHLKEILKGARGK